MHPPPLELSLRRRIAHFVYKLTPPSIDRENLISDIWLEFYQKNLDFSVLRVQSRCIDAMRNADVERRNLNLYRPPESTTLPAPTEQWLNHAIDRAKLSPQQQTLVFLIFYCGLSHRDTRVETNLPLSTISHELNQALSKIGDRL